MLFQQGSILMFNCSVCSLTNNQTSGCFPAGTTSVIWTATDCSGNTATCSQNVTVHDNEPPVITCGGNVSVNSDPGKCGICFCSSQDGFAGSFDSSLWTLNLNGGNGNAFFGELSNGDTALVLAGNSSGLDLKYTKFEITAPCNGIICFNWDWVQFCEYDAFGYSLNNLFHSLTNNESSYLDSGSNCVSVNSGDVFSFTIASQDFCVQNHGGAAVISNFSFTASGPLIPPTATDNCSVCSITNNQTSDCFLIGTTIITWTATDCSGNTATCTQSITVTGLHPVIHGKDTVCQGGCTIDRKRVV